MPWLAAAFDGQDPTLAISKFIQRGIRPSLIHILISYLSDRKMSARFNNEVSEILTLGGGPQGILLGGLEYLVQSNDKSEFVDSKDRFKYVDDLSILQRVFLSGLLVDYNFMQHVPSDKERTRSSYHREALKHKSTWISFETGHRKTKWNWMKINAIIWYSS